MSIVPEYQSLFKVVMTTKHRGMNMWEVLI